MGRILDLIYPENLYCICCDDMIDKERVHGLCDECISKIEWSIENNFENKMDDHVFDDVLSCCIYGVYPRAIIHGLKLKGRSYTASAIAKMLAERTFLSIEEGNTYDVLVPVPLSPKKIKKRGFNQALLLASLVSKELKIPVSDALFKAKETQSSRLSRDFSRFFVQSGAFGILPEKAGEIRGKNILLVDDVITTGSTADECSRVLKEAGASRITVLCFASSPKGVDFL